MAGRVTDISLDELLAEYARLGLTKEDEGLTLRELCDRWGVSDQTARARLYKAQAAGILRMGKKTVARIDGILAPVVCYWFDVPKRRKK